MSNNTASLAQKLECPKKLLGDTRIWTMDLSDCSRLLYHWAISPYDENNVSSEERQVGVTCQNCQSPLAVVTKSKCHHYRIINCIPEHLKRRWYNGQHSCLPSSWSGFDSRPTQCFRFNFGENWDKKVLSMPWPGFEPGLLRPQRRVLTTRRSRLRTVLMMLRTLSLHTTRNARRVKVEFW